MKILGTLFRFLCALIVLLAVTVYLNGRPEVSLLDYAKAFSSEQLLPMMSLESPLAIAAGGLLLLTLCCGLKLGWNIVYSIATLVFFAEAALLALGPEMALPTAIRGLGWEPMLRDLALNYPVPALLVPALCILGSLCSSAPVRIAATSLISCALCYGCAELLSLGVTHWQAMPEPFLPNALSLIQTFPWLLAALPAVFFVQYCIFMAIFETFVKSKKKQKPAEDDRKDAEKAEEKKEPAPKAAAATVAVAATPVVKRPIIHKKSPISPTPAEKKPEAPAEEKKPEPPAEEKKPEAPAEEKKPEAPAEEKKPEAPAEEKKPEAPAEEKKPEAPAPAIPSVPMPPTPNEAS